MSVRQEMADELVALRRNFLPSERAPSVKRRIAQLVSALEASASSKPPTRKRKKRRRKRTRAFLSRPSSTSWLVLLVIMLLASCSLQASPGPRCSASWPVWTRRTVAVAFARLVFLVLHLALCSGV